mmetsp:Transcript_22064/g.56333  ORF Transcript_22064/g.56333 Transcript_22064/m.56333 type:complete len:347 (+) Transcript_22064:1145-2185(+)
MTSSRSASCSARSRSRRRTRGRVAGRRLGSTPRTRRMPSAITSSARCTPAGLRCRARSKTISPRRSPTGTARCTRRCWWAHSPSRCRFGRRRCIWSPSTGPPHIGLIRMRPPRCRGCRSSASGRCRSTRRMSSCSSCARSCWGRECSSSRSTAASSTWRAARRSRMRRSTSTSPSREPSPCSMARRHLAPPASRMATSSPLNARRCCSCRDPRTQTTARQDRWRKARAWPAASSGSASRRGLSATSHKGSRAVRPDGSCALTASHCPAMSSSPLETSARWICSMMTASSRMRKELVPAQSTYTARPPQRAPRLPLPTGRCHRRVRSTARPRAPSSPMSSRAARASS